MSTEQSVDPHLIEQTKQQIRSLVVEIANLSKQDLDVREFYGAFLDRVISALAAIGGAVWAISEAGGLELQYQSNLRETHLADNQESLNAHGQLLQKIVASGEGGLVQPRSGDGQNGQASNPSDFLLILGPIKLDQDTKGVVEVFQRPGAPPTTQLASCGTLPIARRCGTSWKASRGWRTPASTRAKPPSPSPTKGAG